MARLVLLNGPPGIGKTTCARLWADGPDAVVVEIDELRTSIDGWQHDESTRLTARRMAVSQVGRHLRAGTDVIVPQYLGRTELIHELRRRAEEAGASFIEVRLVTDEDTVVARFETRRASGADHPEQDVVDVRAAVADAMARLDERSDVVTVPANGSAQETAALLRQVLDRD